MPTTSRVNSGSITRGSVSSESGSIDFLREGVHIRSWDHLIRATAVKVRVGSGGRIKVINGRVQTGSFYPFNDMESPSTFGSMGYVSQSYVTSSTGIITEKFTRIEKERSSVRMDSHQSASGSIASIPSHFMKFDDYGQPRDFQDGTPFSDQTLSVDRHSKGTINTSDEVDSWKKRSDNIFRGGAIEFISSNPNTILISSEMVDASTSRHNEGAIEIFPIRDEASRTGTEFPFFARGVRGSVFCTDESTFGNSQIITDQYEPYNGHRKETYFLDGIELFGADLIASRSFDVSGSWSLHYSYPFNTGTLQTNSTSDQFATAGPLSMQGFVTDQVTEIRPYIDSTDKLEALTKLDEASYEDSNGREMSIVDALTYVSSNLSLNDSDLGVNHRYATHGFDYINTPIGTDSIAFGGLKK